MKVTITFQEEIQPAVQRHLEQGTSVQDYVRAAVNYFNEMLKVEESGCKCGYGNKDRFTSYNTEVSPSKILKEINY